MRNLQGGIVLQTAPGQGTTFTLYLPAAIAAADAGPKISREKLRDGAGRTILIADDEKAVATIMREVLESADYRSETVASGREAPAAAEKIQPALLLLDLMMPGAPGAEIVRELRARHPRLPIIVISGHSAGEMSEAAPGASAVLEKPFSPAQLLAAVRKALGAA